MLFAPGLRPDAQAIEDLSASGGFAISHRPDQGAAGKDACWLELIATGLTFDLLGLAPGAGGDRFGFAYRYGRGDEPSENAAEVLTLALGPHLAGAEGLMPVVRAAAGLALVLAALPGAIAVGWHPARALSGAGHFRSSVGAWLAGGAFPALGMTALARSPDGTMTSEGLGHLIGQELVLEPANGSSPADDARLAVRLIDRLVTTGPIRSGMTLEIAATRKVILEPGPGDRQIRARRV